MSLCAPLRSHIRRGSGRKWGEKGAGEDDKEGECVFSLERGFGKGGGGALGNNNKRQTRLIKYLKYLVNCTTDA